MHNGNYANSNESGDLRRLDRNAIPDLDEIRLFAKIRNEAQRLPFFLSYYRQLGVNRFFFIDNGSTDGAIELLRNYDDCHIFSTSEHMSKARCGAKWIQPLMDEFSRDRWCVVVDADELLVYPDSETVPLSSFCQTLDRSGSDALLCCMIDMYSDGYIDEVEYTSGTPFTEACPYFDKAGYVWIRRKENELAFGGEILGGPRHRTFYPELLDRSFRGRLTRRILAHCGRVVPALTPPTPILLNKVPLVRWSAGMSLSGAAHDIANARLADKSGALLHFKFLGDFGKRVKEELHRKAYNLGGEAYKKYSNRLREYPVNFMCELSVRYEGTRQLMKLGLMRQLPVHRRNAAVRRTMRELMQTPHPAC